MHRNFCTRKITPVSARSLFLGRTQKCAAARNGSLHSTAAKQRDGQPVPINYAVSVSSRGSRPTLPGPRRSPPKPRETAACSLRRPVPPQPHGPVPRPVRASQLAIVAARAKSQVMNPSPIKTKIVVAAVMTKMHSAMSMAAPMFIENNLRRFAGARGVA
jgi:hypothetical protein